MLSYPDMALVRFFPCADRQSNLRSTYCIHSRCRTLSRYRMISTAYVRTNPIRFYPSPSCSRHSILRAALLQRCPILPTNSSPTVAASLSQALIAFYQSNRQNGSSQGKYQRMFQHSWPMAFVWYGFNHSASLG